MGEDVSLQLGEDVPRGDRLAARNSETFDSDRDNYPTNPSRPGNTRKCASAVGEPFVGERAALQHAIGHPVSKQESDSFDWDFAWNIS